MFIGMVGRDRRSGDVDNQHSLCSVGFESIAFLSGATYLPVEQL
jgi:hypothetical protein